MKKMFLSGDLARLDPELLSPGEMLALTDEPDPAYFMGFRNDGNGGGSAHSVRVVPGSRVRQNDLLLIIGLNRAADPSHALVIAGDHLGWIVLEHLQELR